MSAVADVAPGVTRPPKRAPAALSLRLRLVAILGLSLVLLWSLVAFWMFTGVQRELRAALDDRLAASARMVAGLVARLPPDRLQAGTAAAPLDVAARDGVACEVSLLHGEVAYETLARTAASPGLQSAAPGYGLRVVNGQAWRTYVLRQGALRVATADRVEVREGLLRRILLVAAVPFAAAVSGSLLLLWFGVGGGLRPIERIRRALAARRPDTVEPLPAFRLPPELQPLADTISHLLNRVQDAIARERRFTDDAAHELRTPLTAVKTHLQVLRLACRDRPADAVSAQALANAEAGVLRLQRTIDQLLLLARLEQPETGSTAPVEALHAARLAVADALAGDAGRDPQAPPRIRIEAAPAPAWLALPEPLLVSALRNLLDNALRHGESAAPVRLTIARHGERIEFSVLDEGPGMTPAEIAQATRRFWRRHSRAPGSGLGLSIVEAIAARHGGTLRLAPRAGGPGLEVTLTLPATWRDDVGSRPPLGAPAARDQYRIAIDR